MGSFYTNVIVKPAEQGAVVEALRRDGRVAWVSPGRGGAVVVFDRDTDGQDQANLSALARALSATLGCAAIGFLNHDSDILWFEAWDRGQRVDAYDSHPNYFSGGDNTPRGGDAARLCALFGAAPDAAAEVEAALRKDCLFAEDRHSALLGLLDLPECSVGFGYEYLSRGETPDNEAWDGAMRVGARRP